MYYYSVAGCSSVVSDEVSFLQKLEDPGTELEVPIKKLTVQPLKVADRRLSPRSTSFIWLAVVVGAAELDGGN